MRIGFIGWKVALGLIVAATPALANVPYFNGFETAGSQNDFYGPSGTQGGNITVVTSGGGALHYTAAAGNTYAEITNSDNVGGPQQGYGGYTAFGGTGGVTPNGFGQSFDLYVDLSRWTTTQIPGANLVISTHPWDAVANAQSADLVNFAFTASNTGVLVQSVASTNLATITQSGWYQFTMTFVPGASGFVESDVTVSDLQNNVLGTAHYVPPVGSTLANARIGGAGYMIVGPWQTGFAGDVIAIDNVQTYLIPEPTIVGAVGGLLALIRRRRD